MKENKISSAVIKRLPRYYRYLGELLEQGVERISSGELSKRMKVTASQIRQDLNNFGGFGQQGYGYNVEYLRREIGKILGIDKKHNMIIVGAGRLGQAIANYDSFSKSGFVIKGIFDTDETIIGQSICGVEVMHVSKVAEFIKKNDIDIAALTLPKSHVGEMATIVADAGVSGIWNFAHTDLNLGNKVVVENVHLSESLMRLSYNIADNSKKKKR
ncbi:MAG: redox-sensing transcriptional repressor Rex [Lachnospiraceae bacterium]|nr:redox-sensing transcriptional repressor Rex [Lachnospiraceae bacterium]MBR6697316.1 redox-sensing transcriptional repressor Rex [Lachnospiraceae bacterium]